MQAKQIHDDTKVRVKKNLRVMKYIIEKHNIKIGPEAIERTNGEQHISNCNDNYQAYHTYKSNTFFKEETAA